MYLLKIIKEYLRRILRNYKIYAITILGMSIAIIASFHIYFFVAKEYSVNAFHEHKKDIYRVVLKNTNSNYRYNGCSVPVAKILKEQLPEVVDYVRIEDSFNFKINIGGNDVDKRFTVIDKSFFNLFDFKLIQGDITQFNNSTNGMIISQKMAKMLFGNEDPINKVIQDVGRANSSFRVLGVIDDIPRESTIQGDFFVPFRFLESIMSEGSEWSELAETYLYIPNLADEDAFLEKAYAVLLEANKKLKKDFLSYDLQRLDEVYLHSEDVRNQEVKGSYQYVMILFIVSLLLLLLASVNYVVMNLGLNLNRIKEFQSRRYLGATKNNLYLQLLTESIVNVSICFLLTLVSYSFLSDFVSSILDFDYKLSFQKDVFILLSYYLFLLGIAFVTSFAQFLLLYKPVFNSFSLKTKASGFGKKFLITSQLVLFLVTLMMAFFVNKQLNFIQQTEVGFQKDNIFSVSTYPGANQVKDFLQSRPYVNSFTRGNSLFYRTFNLYDVNVLKTNTSIKASLLIGDPNYVKTHGLEIVAGNDFNPNLVRDFDDKEKNKTRGKEIIEVIVNEEFVKNAGLENPIGTILKYKSYLDKRDDAKIVGVFKNVYNTPLYNAAHPIVVGYNYSGLYVHIFQVNIHPKNREQFKQEYNQFFESRTKTKNGFDRNVSQVNYDEVYEKEIHLKRILQFFSVIVMIIASLGLVAISLFITQNRTKEIGVRKINGATILEILKMLNKSFVIWVGIAFVVAVPVSYLAMQKWLQNFAFKTALSWWVFALSGLLVLLISLLAVSWQTYKAATQNPVEALRDE
ncbi:ABC transporter permease [Polaribacter pacificus]|uniref:ABC transporter permease n=1 Tax=Polaribacter pacificus TaxID=1775173 RepID=A0A917HYB9_9FLAO|nr:ABC transporter permease [Polaribacter pacificus]GGG94088.1 ABC transporter permease [Polaribacter pacificus]